MEIIEEKLKRAEESLNDLEQYIEELSSFLPLAVCTLSPIGNLIDANKAFEKISQFSSLEITGKNLETIFLEKEEIQRIIKETERKGMIEGKKFTLLTKSKEKIPVNLSLAVRKNREGAFCGFFVAISDISELKEFQEKLEEKVKERTKELQERVEELERLHRLTVGRELKMMELKEEIKKLNTELEKYKKL